MSVTKVKLPDDYTVLTANGDALSILPTLEDNTFDVSFTSPPYNRNLDRRPVGIELTKVYFDRANENLNKGEVT